MILGALAATLALAAPFPVYHDRGATAIALAGSDVIVLSTPFKTGAKVVAVPRTGGKPRTLLHVRGTMFDSGTVAASPQRVAVIVEMDNKTDEQRVYSGPPSGPLELVRRASDSDPAGWSPYAISVDGDRLL